MDALFQQLTRADAAATSASQNAPPAGPSTIAPSQLTASASAAEIPLPIQPPPPSVPHWTNRCPM